MREAEAYSRHMNLKLAAHELGMKWQTLYYRLKRAGVPVVGDKLRHGSDRDRLAARAERIRDSDRDGPSHGAQQVARVHRRASRTAAVLCRNGAQVKARSEPYRRFVASQPCFACGIQGFSVARQGSAGRSRARHGTARAATQRIASRAALSSAQDHKWQG